MDRLEYEVTDAALTRIATATENMRLGLHWLDQAAAASNDVITEEAIEATRTAAVQRYHDSLLTPFSRHHRILLEAITLLTAERDTVRSGTVYDWYETLCSTLDQRSMSTRRISDYLTHLELLGIIDVDHHDGGAEGKTRTIRLQHL